LKPEKKVKLFSNQCSQISEDSFWKVVRLHRYAFLEVEYGALVEWY